MYKGCTGQRPNRRYDREETMIRRFGGTTKDPAGVLENPWHVQSKLLCRRGIADVSHRVKPGDVFEIPLEGGRFGVGHVISYDRRNLYYVAVLDVVVRSEERVDVQQWTRSEIACLVGCTLEGVETGAWRVFGTSDADAQAVPRPCFLVHIGPEATPFVESFDGSRRRLATPVDQAILPHRATHSSGVLLRAVKAIAGESPWDDRLERIRLRTLVDQAAACEL
jgi:Immunity protein 26